MSAEHPPETLPILMDRGFDTSMRGYDRRQVDDFVQRLDEDARAAAAQRDAATNRSAELAGQLASAHAQVESLRRQLRAATDQVTEDNLAPRVRELLETAKRTALNLRAEADNYAATTRSGADEAAARIRATAQTESEEILASATQRLAEGDEMFRQRLTEADRYRTEVLDDVAGQVALARAQEEHLTREADAERTGRDAEAEGQRSRLDAESAQERARLDALGTERRSIADEDFEIALRNRRSAEARRSAEQLATAQAEASALVGEARAEAERVARDAAAAVHQLNAQRDQTYLSLRELHERLGAVLEQAATPAR